MDIDVRLLADSPEAVEPVAMLRWQEWGHPPEPEDPGWQPGSGYDGHGWRG